jgi:hypothetical protein
VESVMGRAGGEPGGLSSTEGAILLLSLLRVVMVVVVGVETGAEHRPPGAHYSPSLARSSHIFGHPGQPQHQDDDPAMRAPELCSSPPCVPQPQEVASSDC